MMNALGRLCRIGPRECRDPVFHRDAADTSDQRQRFDRDSGSARAEAVRYLCWLFGVWYCYMD